MDNEREGTLENSVFKINENPKNWRDRDNNILFIMSKIRKADDFEIFDTKNDLFYLVYFCGPNL